MSLSDTATIARLTDEKLTKILRETERMTPTGHYLLPGRTVHSMAVELKELRARNKCSAKITQNAESSKCMDPPVPPRSKLGIRGNSKRKGRRDEPIEHSETIA